MIALVAQVAEEGPSSLVSLPRCRRCDFPMEVPFFFSGKEKSPCLHKNGSPRLICLPSQYERMYRTVQACEVFVQTLPRMLLLFNS